jgi:hypothetical protein
MLARLSDGQSYLTRAALTSQIGDGIRIAHIRQKLLAIVGVAALTNGVRLGVVDYMFATIDGLMRQVAGVASMLCDFGEDFAGHIFGDLV